MHAKWRSPAQLFIQPTKLSEFQCRTFYSKDCPPFHLRIETLLPSSVMLHFLGEVNVEEVERQVL